MRNWRFAVLWVQTGFTIFTIVGFFMEPKHDFSYEKSVFTAILGELIVWTAYIVLLYGTVKSESAPLARLLWSLYGSTTFMIIQILMFATLFRDLGLSADNLSNGTYIYFSIITWTSVGYGELFPSENARFAAAFEALSGYIFMGIFISLVGSYMLATLQRKRSIKTK